MTTAITNDNISNSHSNSHNHNHNHNSHKSHHDEVEDHRFACNICLENVTSPVVTAEDTSTLYCWPCLYVWLEPGMDLAERRYLNMDVDVDIGMDMM
eukprot:CAMPEP_0203717482 /NCGR_PEP_ID=MMETSP0092-20131115/1977_1 /ASSEMBLY_ACC=CAM_ASM_001090 /TAXON_ID=426623 /ORGANISM="Chaetoceros affinis, Strain CCMP159" /LENGTH=96 /DNA_ID=CAMNT_0050596349 /DNA_START=150 /DNA_END=441 /DNA_ORIENTATION=-